MAAPKTTGQQFRMAMLYNENSQFFKEKIDIKPFRGYLLPTLPPF
jgi:hypothetical protein